MYLKMPAALRTLKKAEIFKYLIIIFPELIHILSFMINDRNTKGLSIQPLLSMEQLLL